MLGLLVSTVCVLWFMREAMENERLAVRHKLVEAYRAQLSMLSAELEVHLTTFFPDSGCASQSHDVRISRTTPDNRA